MCRLLQPTAALGRAPTARATGPVPRPRVARTGRDAVAAALRDRIVGGLHTGRMRGGERLAGTRVLAAEFGVNERVVLGALRLLAREGIVAVRPRSGAYVVPPHPSAGTALPHLGTWLVETLVQARARGLPPRDFAEYVRRCTETRRLRAACIECNLDQLHLLCSELTADHGFVTESVEVRALDDAAAALQRADVLVTTRFHATAVRTVAERLGKPWIAVGLRPSVMREVARLLADGPVFYVATDPRYERKLRRMLPASVPPDHLRVLIVGRDDLSAIPPDAPTFVMTSARAHVDARFGRGRVPGRPIHPPRSFSQEAARELLTFMVAANMSAFAAGVPATAGQASAR